VSLERTTPLEIRKQGGERLRVAWADGHASLYAARFLRARCPCASCVDEDTGARRVGEAQVGPEVAIAQVALVGNYAVQVRFSDGHGTGLYSFDYLRRLCGCGECAAA
jgi:prepilin-type processing-associated H-X9-DG protein